MLTTLFLWRLVQLSARILLLRLCLEETRLDRDEGSDAILFPPSFSRFWPLSAPTHVTPQEEPQVSCFAPIFFVDELLTSAWS